MPFPQYTTVKYGRQNDPVGRARFNSLQVKATKRYSNGFTLLAFWTWMKNMSSLQSTQYTPYRPITYSGDSPPHTMVINASYDLPFGRNRNLLVLARIVGGWNISGYPPLYGRNRHEFHRQ